MDVLQYLKHSSWIQDQKQSFFLLNVITFFGWFVSWLQLQQNIPNCPVVMLKDYEFDDDDYKPDELQNDGVVMLKGIQLAFLILILYYFRN